MQVGLRRAAGPLASRLLGSSGIRCAGSWATVDPGALSGSKPGKAYNCGKHPDCVVSGGWVSVFTTRLTVTHVSPLHSLTRLLASL